MADPIWPASLPEPLLSGYTGDRELPIISTDMQQGPRRKARYATTYIKRYNCRFVVDRTQAATFLNFFEDAVNGANCGTNWVDMPIDNGTGVATYRCRIISVQQNTLSSDELIVFNCTVETEDAA